MLPSTALHRFAAPPGRGQPARRILAAGALLAAMFVLAGCAGAGRGALPTRTPLPTWTPTPQGQGQPAGVDNPLAPGGQDPAAQPITTEVVPTLLPFTPTPTPTDTPVPTATNTPEPTATPTDTPVPTPTPTPFYTFDLEEAAKFPTESLAQDVVRVYLYVYAPSEFGLQGYSLRVLHNGVEMEVDDASVGGVPQQTRPGPGEYTRFTNLDVIFVTEQEGEWRIQLLDANDVPAGPPAIFALTADETTRELYVRYRRK